MMSIVPVGVGIDALVSNRLLLRLKNDQGFKQYRQHYRRVCEAEADICRAAFIVTQFKSDASYDSTGFGLQVNEFQTLDMPVTNFYANGVSYASTQKSMMPLSLQQPNKPTQLNSAVGNVTVSTS